MTAKVNNPMWQVPPGAFGSVTNAGSADIGPFLVLVADSTADRAAKVAGDGTVNSDYTWAGVTIRTIPGTTNVKAGAGRVGDVVNGTGHVAVCTASGTIAPGDVVYRDAPGSGNNGRVKKYTNFA